MPTGCSIFPKENPRPSRRWAASGTPDIRYWNELDRGGHFAAFEQPGAVRRRGALVLPAGPLTAGVRRHVPGESASGGDQVRAAEVIAALSLATDLGMGFPLEHGLHSTIVAMRLARRLGVDVADRGSGVLRMPTVLRRMHRRRRGRASLFDEGTLLTALQPGDVRVAGADPGRDRPGPRRPDGGLCRARVPRTHAAPARRAGIAGTSWRCARSPQMLTERLGVPAEVTGLFVTLSPNGGTARGSQPVSGARRSRSAIRIVQVARDATFHHVLGGDGPRGGRDSGAVRPRLRPGGRARAGGRRPAPAGGRRDGSAWDADAGHRAGPLAPSRGRRDRPRARGDGRLRRPAFRRTWSGTRRALPSWPRPRRPGAASRTTW